MNGTPSIPGYHLLDVLGRGAHGTVYRARTDDALGREFAVKVFSVHAHHDFSRELEPLKRIETIRRATGSPHLLETIHAGVADHTPYVVTQLAPHGSLADLVRARGPLPTPDAVPLILPVLDALTLLHTHDLLHRDVKPANILLDDTHQPRLADFGLARLNDGAPLSNAGTPGFCPPELYRGTPQPHGPPLDTYAAAATLYYLLTGDAPLPGRPDLFALERHRVPRPLQDTLRRALHEDPAQRTPTPALLRQHLLHGPSSPPRRLPRVLAFAVLAALALAALLWPTPPPPPPTELALAAARPSWDGRTLAWDPAWTTPPHPTGLARPLVHGSLGPRGRLWVGTSDTGELVAWQRTADRPLRRTQIPAPASRPSHPLLSVATDGTHLVRLTVSGDTQGPAALLDVFDLDGTPLLTLHAPWSAAAVALAPHPAGGLPHTIFGTLDGRLLICAWGSARPHHTVSTPADGVLALGYDASNDTVWVLGERTDPDDAPSLSLTGAAWSDLQRGAWAPNAEYGFREGGGWRARDGSFERPARR